jgi:hypothetical protein
MKLLSDKTLELINKRRRKVFDWKEKLQQVNSYLQSGNCHADEAANYI